MPVLTKSLVDYTHQLLNCHQIDDYCPNGLQIEGAAEIKTIIGGVTASQALIQQAIAAKADALLVHHGYFWKGESATLTGIKGQRIRQLIEHNINLIAYHLPLDIHPKLGNNAGLAELLGIHDESENPTSLLRLGSIEPCSIERMIQHIQQKLNRPPTHLPGGKQTVKTIAWCTGAAQDMIEEAASLNADVFMSGEVSERTTHLAQELGIHYLACGHHATEIFGVQALGQHWAEKFDVSFKFINIDNPI